MAFEPQKHVIKVRGADYLETKWRLAWLNDEIKVSAAAYRIQTEILEADATHALVKATVSLLDDNGVTLKAATGHKWEDQADFADYVAKAETQAVGRALAHLGYGTEFDGGQEVSGTEQGTGRSTPRRRTDPTDARTMTPADAAKVALRERFELSPEGVVTDRTNGQLVEGGLRDRVREAYAAALP